MNVKEYISSGMVESYVMGLLTEAERQEFEALCAQYPEIASARTAFEQMLEIQLLSDAQQPPAHLKQQIEDKLTAAGSETNTEEVEEERPAPRIGVWKWLAAASLILLAGAAYWAFTTNKKYQDQQTAMRELRDSLAAYQNQGNPQQNAQTGQPVSDFKIASIKEGTEASATIYWDTTSKDVYLMINNMPQPASDKQYQLWALLPEDGAAPVDLGMIELKTERTLYKMKNVQNAKAFAITLEPKGGVPSPTGKPMVSTQPKNL